jgi:hypothetical protein
MNKMLEDFDNSLDTVRDLEVFNNAIILKINE